MYVERQVGNQCRRHALNAYFGGAVLQWNDLEKYSKDFEKFYNLPSTNKMKNDYDYFNSDGSSLLTYIGEQILPERFFLVIPNGKITEWIESIGLSLDNCDDSILVFHSDHVYCIKRQQGKWFILDSLSPTPYQVPLQQILSDKRLGLVISFDKQVALQIAWNLEKNIVTFLNQFSDLHMHTVTRFLDQGTLGDAHDMLENWSMIRLRLLAFIRGKTSVSKRLFHHANLLHYYSNEKQENKKIITYIVIMS